MNIADLEDRQPGTRKKRTARVVGGWLETECARAKESDVPGAANTGDSYSLDVFSRNPTGHLQKRERSETASLVVQNWGGESRQQQDVPPGGFPCFPSNKDLILGEKSNTVALRVQEKSHCSWGRGRNTCQIQNFVLGVRGRTGSLHPQDPGHSVCDLTRTAENGPPTTTTPLTQQAKTQRNKSLARDGYSEKAQN